MKTNLLFLVIFSIGLMSQSQNTYIPDDNFEQALIDFGYDTAPLDDYVPTDNINTVVELNVAFRFINDLTGIEDFTALSTLDCSMNSLTNLNVSNNYNLTVLSCWSNPLGSLDVSNNYALTTLNCSSNELSSLDVSNNFSLTTLDCSVNNISSLELYNNTELTNLYCDYNNLSSLDVSYLNNLTILHCVSNSMNNLDLGGISTLTELYCSWNNLSTLNVSENSALTHLYCDNNNLVSLDLNKNLSITNLLCRSNNLSSLNLKDNTQLIYLICDNNNLNNLDVKNGNNTNFTHFRAHGNPNLTCINVDNAAWSTANWTYIDAQSYFNEDCAALNIKDFDLSSIDIYPNPVQDFLTIKLNEVADYSIINLKSQNLIKGKLINESNTINVSNISNGLYVLKVKTKEGIITKKFIKQ